jgi:hypothetical protein
MYSRQGDLIFLIKNAREPEDLERKFRHVPMPLIREYSGFRLQGEAPEDEDVRGPPLEFANHSNSMNIVVDDRPRFNIALFMLN